MNVIRIDEDPIQDSLDKLYRRRRVLNRLIRQLEDLPRSNVVIMPPRPKPDSEASESSPSPSEPGVDS